MSDQESGSASDTKDEGAPKKRPKMSADHKTPISLLTELCTKSKVGQPAFSELERTSLPENFCSEPHLKFFIQVKAFNKSAIGAGATKQSAKHAAAQLLLNKMNSPHGGGDDDDDDDDDMSSCYQNVANSDYITELLNFCVQKNYHKPEIVEIDSFGPTHCPTFIFECRIDSIACRSSASSKQLAKQLAAKMVLDIFKASYPDMEKKVAVINNKNMDIEEEIRRKITTYMELKKRGMTEKMGHLIKNRHTFFENYKNELVSKELKQVLAESVSDDVKCRNLLAILDKEWGYKITTLEDTALKQFELLIDFDQFTVVLVESNEEKLKTEVLRYFTFMLDTTPSTYCDKPYKSDNLDLTMYPLAEH